MQREYQIQEMLRQDSLGTIFRAKEEETGKSVVIRHFQPGSPLPEEVATKFVQWVGAVCCLEIPGLRTILEGGINPDDGVPYLVHEWIEGSIVADYEGLGSENWLNILKFGLELSEKVSQRIGQEAMWVEWAMDEILINSSDLSLSFWLQPPLARPGQQDYGIPRLLDQLAGWLEEVIQRDPELRGALSSWIAVLRATGDRWDFAGLWLSLDKKLHPDAPAPLVASTLLVPPTVPLPQAKVSAKRGKANRVEWVIVSILVVIFLILFGLLLKKSQSREKKDSTELTPIKVIDHNVASSVTADSPEAAAVADPAAVTSEPVVSPLPEPVQEVTQHTAAPVVEASAGSPKAVIPQHASSSHETTGRVKAVTQSKSGKTFYLELTEATGGTWVACRAATTGMTLEKLTEYIGKRIRAHGEMNDENSFRKEVLLFSSPGDLEVLE